MRKLTDEERCRRQWERALKQSGPVRDRGHRHVAPTEAELDIMAKSAGFTRTNVFTIAPVAVTNGTLVRVPATGGRTIPNNLGYVAVEVFINLTTEDKEAVGKTLAMGLYRLNDDSFVAGFPGPDLGVPESQPWVSYGGPFVSDLDGTLDPDPGFRIPLVNLKGQQIYIKYFAQGGISTAGVTVNGIS